MHPASDHPILIAGGGIGGLATALALAKHGLPSKVLERRAALAEEGAGIQIGPHGMRVLSWLGVDGPLRASAAEPDNLRVMNARTARELCALPLGSWIARRHGAPYCTVHRQDLHAALLEHAAASPLIDIETNAEVVDAETYASGVSAKLANGSTLSGAALIGADGLWSSVRAKYFDAQRPRFSGKCAYRSVMPRDAIPDNLRGNDVRIWLASGAHIVDYPVRGGTERALVAIFSDNAQSEAWSTDATVSEVYARTTKFAQPLKDLLRAANHWRKWSLYERAMPSPLAKGTIALLGDAAHPVLPFLAQGTVMALEDACVISAAIAKTPGDIPSALMRYESDRRARVIRVQAASRRNGQIYQMSSFLAAARNSVLRTLPAGRLMAGYDWLYGWTPPQ